MPSNNTLVMKFGGTSVGSYTAIRSTLAIIANARQNWKRIVVVTSAMSGVTDGLLEAITHAEAGDTARMEQAIAGLRDKHIEAANLLVVNQPGNHAILAELNILLDQLTSLCRAVSILGEASPRARDAIASFGERLAVRLLVSALQPMGVPARTVDANEVIVTDSDYQNANPDVEASAIKVGQVLTPILEEGTVPVFTGFIGANPAGVITTLGRGGSDFSAALLGVLLQAEEVWIWTDVDGVMTADPRVVPSARTIERISFREISELAYFGAKVLHPKTIRPVIEAGITLKVLNTFNPGHPGTLILPDIDVKEDRIIKSVTQIKDLKLITLDGRGILGVPGVAARLFGAIAATGTSVPLISQASSEQSICFAVPARSARSVIARVRREFEHEIGRRDIDGIWAGSDVVIISVVGAGMRSIPGVAGRIFSILGDEQINVIAIAQGSSEVSISFIVDAADASRAVRALHSLIQ